MGICRDPWGKERVRQVLELQPEQGIQDPFGLSGLMVTFCISLRVFLPFFHLCFILYQTRKFCFSGLSCRTSSTLCPCRTAPGACGDLYCGTGGSTKSHLLPRVGRHHSIFLVLETVNVSGNQKSYLCCARTQRDNVVPCGWQQTESL